MRVASLTWVAKLPKAGAEDDADRWEERRPGTDEVGGGLGLAVDVGHKVVVLRLVGGCPPGVGISNSPKISRLRKRFLVKISF